MELQTSPDSQLTCNGEWVWVRKREGHCKSPSLTKKLVHQIPLQGAHTKLPICSVTAAFPEWMLPTCWVKDRLHLIWFPHSAQRLLPKSLYLQPKIKNRTSQRPPQHTYPWCGVKKYCGWRTPLGSKTWMEHSRTICCKSKMESIY